MKTFPLYTVYISITIPMVWELLHIQMQKEWPFWSRGPPKSLQLHGPLHRGMSSASQLAAGFSVLGKTVIHSSLLQLHIRNSSDIGSQRFTLVINSLSTPMPSSHFKQSLKIKKKKKENIAFCTASTKLLWHSSALPYSSLESICSHFSTFSPSCLQTLLQGLTSLFLASSTHPTPSCPSTFPSPAAEI